jgi:2-acylglycerol O-acyltransferase 2
MSANGEVHPAEPGEKSFAEVVKQPPSHTSQQQNGEDDQFDETISKDPGVPAELLEQPSEHSDAETNGVAPNITQPPIPEPPGDLTYADAAAESPPPLPEETDDEGAGQEDASAPAVQPPTPIELTGVGLDEAPRSPSRFGHRRGGSKGSIKANGKPKTSASSESSIVSQSDLALVFEKYPDGQGGKLTSVRAPPDYEQNLLQDERERSPNVRTKGELELVSGRQAAAGWERSGYVTALRSLTAAQRLTKHHRIRWAPLNVPLKRRLQTLAVLCHNLSIAMFLSTFLFLAAIPLLWPIILPYLIYVLFSNAGTSGTLRWRSNYLRSMKVWSLFASYFPARLHRTEELPATRKYIFGYHPHGIISHGAFAAFSTEALGFSHLFPGITNTLLTLDSNFRTPLYREYILSMGLASVSRESCENLLSKGGPNGQGMGRGITIVVGGARESLETQPGTLRLVLHRRKGFIKLAIRTGADLVPVLGFGENDIYQQLSKDEHPWLHKGQLLAKKFLGFTLPIFHARGIFNYDVGMMPYRRPINIVVGRPIKVMQQSSPDKEYVEELHGKYIRELRWIWETYKDEFARERIAEMEIVE